MIGSIKKIPPFSFVLLNSCALSAHAIISPLAFSSYIRISKESPFHNNSLCACQSSPRETKRQVCQQQWLRRRVIYVDCCWCALALAGELESHLANNDNGPLHPPAESRGHFCKKPPPSRQPERETFIAGMAASLQRLCHGALHGAVRWWRAKTIPRLL